MAENDNALTFTNPIAARGQDPWVVRHDGLFYYCYSAGGKIGIRVSDRLEKIGDGEEHIAWRPPKDKPYSKEIWAPELHHIGSRWYIYFAADDGNNHNHRMYVVQSEANDPLGPYKFVGKVADETNKWAIDGTVLQHNDKLYFIWSGWPGNENVVQNLYIAPMSDPVTISGKRALISEPTHDWERIGDPKVNEGPEVLTRGDKVHIIYSASGSWTDDYCLGRLTLTDNDDPMNPASWVKHNQPVFKRTQYVFGPGHASFVYLENATGPKDWIIYHATQHQGAGWKRDVRLQPFTWDADNNPVFSEPIQPGVPIETP